MRQAGKKSKYNYSSLIVYCDENNIVLLKDYSNEIINRETKIEAKCKTTNCNKSVNKSFRHIIERTGCYCNLCSIKNGKIKQKETCLKKYGLTKNCLKFTVYKCIISFYGDTLSYTAS